MKYDKPSDKWERYLTASIKQQERIAKRISQIQTIMKMRKENEETLRGIGKKLGLSGEAIRLQLKVFGLK